MICCEPVTVLAAPWNEIFIVSPSGWSGTRKGERFRSCIAKLPQRFCQTKKTGLFCGGRRIITRVFEKEVIVARGSCKLIFQGSR
jgi:hypothetical protein